MSSRSNTKRARKLGNTSRPSRRCPECGRGMALILNVYYGVRYCRWAADGKCALTEARAVESRPEPTVRLLDSKAGEWRPASAP